MENQIVKWLLDGDPWVEYRTRLDLLKQSEDEKEVLEAKENMVLHPQIQFNLNHILMKCLISCSLGF